MPDARGAGPRPRIQKADRPADRGDRLPPPVLRALSARECEALLARNMVGRVAFAHRGHVNIAPMLYVLVDGWLYARADAAMRVAIRHNRWVAVEVAEVKSVSAWRSVVVRGACYSTTESGSTTDNAIVDGISQLRRQIPEMSRPGSGAPFRTAIYRLHVDELTGYSAQPSQARRRRRAPDAANQDRADDDGMRQTGAEDR